jgi:hypothetical protein
VWREHQKAPLTGCFFFVFMFFEVLIRAVLAGPAKVQAKLPEHYKVSSLSADMY